MNRDLDLFEEREAPPMSADMFTTLVVARLRADGRHVEGQGRLEITIRSEKGPAVVSLGDYYRRYRVEPSDLSPLIREFVEAVARGRTEPDVTNRYDQVAPNLLPLLVSVRDWQNKREAGVQIVVRPFVGDVGLALVVDGDESFTYVDLERFESWQVDVGSAFETALANLARRSQGVPFSQTGEGPETLLVDRGSDGYAATRAVLNSRLDDWASRVPGELLLGIPSRGFLIGLSSGHSNLQSLAAQVERDSISDEHGLSKDLLVYRDHKPQVYPIRQAESNGA